MDIKTLIGKAFTDSTGNEYGPLRETQGALPEELTDKEATGALAEDGCGNYFITNGKEVLFWDHETNQTVPLASSLEAFFDGCAEPSEIELQEGQVLSVWIDPEFAKKLGLDEKP